MELITIDKKNKLFNTTNITDKELFQLISKDSFKNEYIKEDYFFHLRLLTYNNEENGKNRFEGFNDITMIYYFIHRQRHVNKEKKLSKTTKKDYARDILQFYGNWILFLDGNKLSMNKENLFKLIEPRHIEMYQTDFLPNSAHYKPATIARKSVVLRSFLHWLYKVGYITTPLHEAFISSELSMEDKPDRDLSYPEVKMILDYWERKKHPINYPILLLLATSGLRVAEVAKAKWGDIFYDYSSGNYFLSSVGKNKKHRDVVIFPYVLDALKIIRKRRKLPIELDPTDMSPVIPTIKQQFYDHTYLSRYVKKIIQETNLPFLESKEREITPHWFRHFFANHSLDNGAGLEYIRQTLGHSLLKTTQGYLRKNMERKNNAALTWNMEKF